MQNSEWSKKWSYHGAIGEAAFGDDVDSEPWPDELWKDMSTPELMRLAQDVAGELRKRREAVETFQSWLEEGSSEAWEDAV